VIISSILYIKWIIMKNILNIKQSIYTREGGEQARAGLHVPFCVKL
jgi:hypothetical protein